LKSSTTLSLILTVVPSHFEKTHAATHQVGIAVGLQKGRRLLYAGLDPKLKRSTALESRLATV
jgi:hypothetical protein